jgi:hypothetical protein
VAGEKVAAGSGRLGAALLSQRGEILLTGFECIHFRSGRAFRIHREPDRPDHDADNTSRDILSDLGVILVREFFCLDIVRLDLGADHGSALPRSIKPHAYWVSQHSSIRLDTERSRNVPVQCVEKSWNMITVRSRGIHMPARRFPPPCTFDEANHACFIVRDGNRFPVAYVYFESKPGRRTAANLLTRDEARRIAANIAKLPELVKRPQD